MPHLYIYLSNSYINFHSLITFIFHKTMIAIAKFRDTNKCSELQKMTGYLIEELLVDLYYQIYIL